MKHLVSPVEDFKIDSLHQQQALFLFIVEIALSFVL